MTCDIGHFLQCTPWDVAEALGLVLLLGGFSTAIAFAGLGLALDRK